MMDVRLTRPAEEVPSPQLIEARKSAAFAPGLASVNAATLMTEGTLVVAEIDGVTIAVNAASRTVT